MRLSDFLATSIGKLHNDEPNRNVWVPAIAEHVMVLHMEVSVVESWCRPGHVMVEHGGLKKWKVEWIFLEVKFKVWKLSFLDRIKMFN